MINSISLSGGIPGKTSGNTSGYSQTIRTWSMVGWARLLLHLNWRGKVSDICSTNIPVVLVMVMAFLAQSIIPLCLDIQSIPSTTSKPLVPSTIRLASKSMPWIRIGTALQICLALVVDPGICIIITCFSLVGWILLVHANSSVTNECDAPESNNTLASTELTENIPSTTSGASWASSACMRKIRPLRLREFPGTNLLPG